MGIEIYGLAFPLRQKRIQITRSVNQIEVLQKRLLIPRHHVTHLERFLRPPSRYYIETNSPIAEEIRNRRTIGVQHLRGRVYLAAGREETRIRGFRRRIFAQIVFVLVQFFILDRAAHLAQEILHETHIVRPSRKYRSKTAHSVRAGSTDPESTTSTGLL